MASKKEVAVSKKVSLVATEDEIKDLSALVIEDGSQEQLSQDELELPFLRVAQKGSPQVDDAKPEYIEGLKPGQYFNTASGKSYGDSIVVQVHGYFRNFIIWKGPKGAGKYSGSMTAEEFRKFEAENTLQRSGGDFVQIADGEEFRYTDTRNFIVTLPEYPEEGVMIYSLSSTGIKPAKKWNTINNTRLIGGKQTKRYATLWQLKSAGFEKDGYTWKQTATIEALGWASPDLQAYGQSQEDFVNAIKVQGVKFSSESEAAESSDF